MSDQSPGLFFRGSESPDPFQILVTPILADGALGPSERTPVDWPFAVVGRSPGCDIVLADPAASSRHCYLQALGPKILCVDLGSRNGLLLGEVRRQAAWIDRGQSVRVGNHLLSLDGGDGRPGPFANEEGVDPEDSASSVFQGKVPKVVLDFRSSQFETCWSMKRAIALVGSSQECGIRLNNPLIAPFHAAFVRTTTGLWVVDLLSCLDSTRPRGLSVNGCETRAACLYPGDALEIGPFRVSPRYSTSTRSKEFSATEPKNVPEPGESGWDPGPEGDPSAPATLGMVRGLSSSLQTRFLEVIDRQAAEINALRREVEELRLRTESAGGGSRSIGKPRISGTPGRKSTTVRILGSALRDSSPVALPPPQLHVLIASPTPNGFGVDEVDPQMHAQAFTTSGRS